MSALDKKISDLEAEIEGYRTELASVTDLDEKKQIRGLMTERSGVLRLLMEEKARSQGMSWI